MTIDRDSRTRPAAPAAAPAARRVPPRAARVAAAVARHQERWVVAGIMLLAAVLRLWQLDRVGLRGDEAVYAGQAAVLAGDHSMDRYFILASRGNSNFLLFQEIVSVVYRVFGVSDVAARVVSALLSIGTVLLVYLIGRQLYGRRAGAFAAGLLAVGGYSVDLGRLALLDSCATFFVVLAVFFLVRWQAEPRTGALAGLAAASALAVQAKLPSALLFVVFVATLVVSGSWRRLRPTAVGVGVLAAVVASTPAIYQLVTRYGSIVGFLGTSLHRHSPVPWHYYLDTLLHYDGAAVVAVLALGVVLAGLHAGRTDLVPGLWLLVFGGFIAVYPLKAFNYLLPVIPAVMILAGRGLATVRLPRVPAPVLVGGLAAVGIGISAPSLAAAVHDDSSAGVREAARWLQQHAPVGAGVMTLSQGSAQYVYSFYANRDAYPFGRFRLDTVLPGRRVVSSPPTPPGRLPTDWVSGWPPKLIRQGAVSYLIYATGTLDDPPEQNQIVGTMTERQFRGLIETFGGQLVHRVTWHHEVRVYIYRITRRLGRPAVSVVFGGTTLRLHGQGFEENSPLTITYHGGVLLRTHTDATGSVDVTLNKPDSTQLAYHLAMTDGAGNYASLVGLPAASVALTTDHQKVFVRGEHFSADAPVTVTYHEQVVFHTTAGRDGSVTFQIPLPAHTQPRYRLRLTDSTGRTAWAVGLPAPSIHYAVSGGMVQVSGQNFLAASPVTLTYRGLVVGSPTATASGSFTASFPLPTRAGPHYRLVATDSAGRTAVATGLPQPQRPSPKAGHRHDNTHSRWPL